jgi:tetratricopeptide (TPR) repeat protein
MQLSSAHSQFTGRGNSRIAPTCCFISPLTIASRVFAVNYHCLNMFKRYLATSMAIATIAVNSIPVVAQIPTNPTPQPTVPIVGESKSVKARGYFESGLTKYESMDYGGAIADLSRAIKIDPKYVNAYIYRGAMQGIFKQQPKLAIIDFDRAIKLAPKNGKIYAYRGYAKLAQNRKKAALIDLQKAITLNPQSLLPHFAIAFAKDGKFSPKELDRLTKVLEQQKDPDLYFLILIGLGRMSALNGKPSQKIQNTPLTTAKAHFNRSLTFLANGDPLGAKGDLDRAIALDPKFVDAYMYRAFLNLTDDKDRGKKSLVDFTKVIELDPQRDRAYFYRAIIKLFAETDRDTIINDLDRAIAINPKFIFSYIARSFVKRSLLVDAPGGISDAIAATKVAREQGELEMYLLLSSVLIPMTKEPVKADEYINLAQLQHQENQDQKALASFAKAIEMDGKNENAHIQRAKFYIATNNNPAALADFDRAIQIAPESVESIKLRADFKRDKLKDNQGALADYNKAIDLKLKKSDDKAYLGSIYAERGILKYQNLNDNKGATADFDLAMTAVADLVTDRVKILVKRGNFKRDKLKDPAGSLADYDQAISLSQDTLAYIERGNLKRDLQNDFKGGLADYNKAIEAEDSNLALAYYQRAALKQIKLKDNQGAISDYRKAAELYRENKNREYWQKTIANLKSLGVNE